MLGRRPLFVLLTSLSRTDDESLRFGMAFFTSNILSHASFLRKDCDNVWLCCICWRCTGGGEELCDMWELLLWPIKNYFEWMHKFVIVQTKPQRTTYRKYERWFLQCCLNGSHHLTVSISYSTSFCCFLETISLNFPLNTACPQRVSYDYQPNDL